MRTLLSFIAIALVAMPIAGAEPVTVTDTSATGCDGRSASETTLTIVDDAGLAYARAGGAHRCYEDENGRRQESDEITVAALAAGGNFVYVGWSSAGEGGAVFGVAANQGFHEAVPLAPPNPGWGDLLP